MAQDMDRVVGSSYLLDFKESCDALIGLYAEYLPVIKDLADKETKRQIGDVKEVKAYCDAIRKYCIKNYISYTILQKSMKKDKNAAIERVYNEIIKKETFLNPEEIETFILEISEFLFSDAIRSVMETAEDIMGRLYSQKNES